MWWFAIAGGVVLAGFLVVLGFVVLENGDNSANPGSSACSPAETRESAGNAQIDAQALGNGFARQIVIHVTDKKSGLPVRGATVSVQGTMTCPHVMPLYQKNLREAPNGTYRGDYQLIMQGNWEMHVLVRSKQGGATTSAFPLTVKIRG
jgi:hypothetical protein